MAGPYQEVTVYNDGGLSAPGGFTQYGTGQYVSNASVAGTPATVSGETWGAFFGSVLEPFGLGGLVTLFTGDPANAIGMSSPAGSQTSTLSNFFTIVFWLIVAALVIWMFK